MTDKEIVTAYAGARVTQLVNRRAILDQVEAAVRDRSGRTYVFYLEADGGMGKTFLAREVLRRCSRRGEWFGPDLLAARHEVDFYHHQSRSINGFMAALVDALRPGGQFFASYEDQRREIEQAGEQMHSALNDPWPMQAELRDRFLEGCRSLGEKHRVVVALDTAEKLSYETDRVQPMLTGEHEALSARPWLLAKWLPAMCNAVILICGRPRTRIHEQFQADLRTAVEACPHMELSAPPLPNFELEETRQYLVAVRNAARRDHNSLALRRLRAISDENVQVMHALTQGRPISLALFIDYYLMTTRLPDEARLPIENVETLDSEERDRRRRRLDGEIVRLFRERGRPADEAILSLAWARMGMDADLLSRVAGMTPDEAQAIIDTLADPATGLSFVKIRRPDNRAFLHDEMYDLIQERVLDAMTRRKEEVLGIIREYYAERIAAQEQEIRTLQEQRRERTSGARHRALAAARAALDDLRVEDVFYRLRQDPLQGFFQYCEYAQEAVISRNDNLDMQLRDEMLAYVRDAFGDREELGGLRRDAVERDSALRWGWWAVYAGHLKEAKMVTQHLRKEGTAFMGQVGSLAWAELDIIRGWAEAFLGTRMAAAEKDLARAIKALLPIKRESDLEWRRRMILLAQAYHALGYLLRVQGRFQQACEVYHRALPLWRWLRREGDHAETLNNLGWAHAEAGHMSRALRSCRNALELRQRLGSLYPIALSYNTLGLIETRYDQPHRGLVHCRQALEIFHDLGAPRGYALAAIALAEAYRRRGGLEEVYPPDERAEDMRWAEFYAEQAVAIFREQVTEPLRKVEALNEMGCVYRDWAYLARYYRGDDDPDVDTLVTKAKDHLEEAARLATKTYTYRNVDSLVDLAWLYAYVERPDADIEAVLDHAEEHIPAEYRIRKGVGLPQRDLPVSSFWAQLGKIGALRGRLAMRRYWDRPRVTKGQVRDLALLKEATHHFTLSLAYSELFAEDSRDMRRAKDLIYTELRRANVGEFRAIYATLREITFDYNLDFRALSPEAPARPRMRNFLEENFGTLAELEQGPSWP